MSEPIMGTSEWQARTQWAASQIVPADAAFDDEASLRRMYRLMELMGLHYGYEIEVSVLREHGTGEPVWQVVQRDKAHSSNGLIPFTIGVLIGVMLGVLLLFMVVYR